VIHLEDIKCPGLVMGGKTRMHPEGDADAANHLRRAGGQDVQAIDRRGLAMADAYFAEERGTNRVGGN
jgi:hypothetical protein